MRKLPPIDTYLLYLISKPYEIVTTKEIIDGTQGIYPTYYCIENNKLLVSNSAYALIKHLGNFEKHINENLKVNWLVNSFETYDTRVHRIKPFQHIFLQKGKLIKENTFSYPNTINDLTEFIDLSAELLTRHIQLIEESFPNTKHIVEVGGKDSQMILLIPKKRPENWYVFSGKPNTEIVKEFISLNGIKINGFFSDKGGTSAESDDEYHDPKFIKEKVIASDALINLATLQWGKTHREQIKEFKENVVFWDGTSGGNLNTPHNIKSVVENSKDKGDNETRKAFYNCLFINLPVYQGLYHQYLKNLLGTPVLDLYSSPRLWQCLYSKYNPLMFSDFDCRKLLGDKIFGKEVKWIDKNPAPPAWRKQSQIDIKKIYFEALR